MDFASLRKSCEENPLLCVIGIVLLLAVVQNCVMDIGLGPWLGRDSFSNLTGGDNSTGEVVGHDTSAGAAISAPAAAESLGGNEQNQGVAGLSRTPSTCYPQPALKPEDLLPAQESKAIQEFNIAQPIGEGILADVNLLDAGSHIGINSVGQSLRNANQQIRSEPPNPQVNVSPWMNTTIGPDLPRRPLEIGESCSA
jgi:hypothetical protein